MWNRVFAYPLGLLLLCALEWFCTLGCAFEFNHYTIFGWIAQTIVIIMTIGATELSVQYLEEEEN